MGSYCSSKRITSHSTVSGLLLLLPLVMLSTDMAAGQKDTNTVINVETFRPQMPVLISELRIGDSKVISGAGLNGPADWLQQIHIVVVNKTIKPITAMSVYLTFPQTGTGASPASPRMAYEMRLGNLSAAELVDPNGRQLHEPLRPPLDIPPGGSMDINVGSAYPDYSSMLGLLLHGRTPRICNIRIMTVSFSDGTRWGGNSFVQVDPEHPGHYVQIPADGFFNK